MPTKQTSIKLDATPTADPTGHKATVRLCDMFNYNIIAND